MKNEMEPPKFIRKQITFPHPHWTYLLSFLSTLCFVFLPFVLDYFHILIKPRSTQSMLNGDKNKCSRIDTCSSDLPIWLVLTIRSLFSVVFHSKVTFSSNRYCKWDTQKTQTIIINQALGHSTKCPDKISLLDAWDEMDISMEF